MLGTKELEAVLGTGIDNTNHEAVRATIRSMADLGLNVLFIIPGTKDPADMRAPAARNKADREAKEAAKDAGHRGWAKVKSPSGLSLATSDKATLDRYLKRYIEVYSTWRKVDDGVNEIVTWTKKEFDAGEIVMAEPAAVNIAIEVGGSGVVVVDCDTAAQMDRWFEVAGLASDDDKPAPTIITPGQVGPGGDADDQSSWAHSDGGHFWFTVPDKFLPVLPRHFGAMTWGGDNGFAVLWDRRYVLVPPSTRPEGAYEYLGHVYDLPDWLAQEIIETGARRVQRAELSKRTDNESLASAIDNWAETVSWASILEPLGWTPAPRVDACGCAVWTAPGIHASPKSATAHDTGCSSGRYTEVNAPLYIWTDHDIEPFGTWVHGDPQQDLPAHGQTISKLQAVAIISYAGGVGRAMDDLGLTPNLAVGMEGLNPKAMDADLDRSGDGGFQMPANVEATVTDGPDPDAPDMDTDLAVKHRDEAGARDTNIRCQCGILIHPDMPNVMPDDDGDLWHDPISHEGQAEQEAHLVVAEPTQTPSSANAGLDVDALLGDLASPYADYVETPDPDVFDSPHAGVPRIAPFSHWRDMPPPEYIIDGLIEHGGLSCLIGAPGIGKSTVALDMICHIATGKRWQGRTTLKTKVLYLPGEGLSGAVQRITAWEHAHGVSLDNDLLLGNGIIQVAASNEAWGDVAAYVVRQGVGLVVFDTFARMNSGLEENSATDVGRAVKRYDSLKELTNVGVFVVHHTGKGSPDVGRGSSALNGALDSELLVRHAQWDTDPLRDASGRMESKPIELWTSKQKNAEQLEHAIPLLLKSYTLPDTERSIALITGPSGEVDPMQGEIVIARPLPETVVETAIRVRTYVDNLPQQGASRADLLLAIRPDSYARSRNDEPVYWKQRLAEAVDKGLRYTLIETLSGTASGQRYIPGPTTPDQARTLAAAEVVSGDND
jgi:hypothetical protein